MLKSKRDKLKSKGWKVGSAEEFLGLSSAEAKIVELKLKLSSMVRELRIRKRLTQVELAQQIGSSQSRVAKMERGDPSVSIDLLVHSIYSLGGTNANLGKTLARSRGRSAV